MENILTLREEELYEILGNDLIKGQKQAFPLTQSQIIDRGKKWFNAKVELLRKSVCPYQKTIATESDEKKALVQVADLVAKLTLGVSPFAIAALLLKIGLKHLCEDQQSTGV